MSPFGIGIIIFAMVILGFLVLSGQKELDKTKSKKKD